MSRKTFCDMCGAEIKGNSSKVVAISAEYEDLCVCISRRRWLHVVSDEERREVANWLRLSGESLGFDNCFAQML